MPLPQKLLFLNRRYTSSLSQHRSCSIMQPTTDSQNQHLFSASTAFQNQAQPEAEISKPSLKVKGKK
jgi:hypothetical protein